MGFGLHARFNLPISGRRDIPLSDEEYDIIEKDFLPSTKKKIKIKIKEPTKKSVKDSNGKYRMVAVDDDKERLLEARGRISFIEGQPRLPEIKTAIENRNYVSIYYRHRNGKKGHRLIEPYALGKGLITNSGDVTKPNQHYIRAFVIMNSESDKTTKGRFSKTKSVSVSDKRNRWRLFRVDRIEQWTNMDKKFSSYRRQYNPNDKQLNNIITSLPYSAFPKKENPRTNF